MQKQSVGEAVASTIYNLLSQEDNGLSADAQERAHAVIQEPLYTDLDKLKADKKLLWVLLPILKKLSTSRGAWSKFDEPNDLTGMMQALCEAVEYLERQPS